MDYLKRKFGVTRPVFILSVVSFLHDIASEMLYPVIPIFLTTVLGAPASVVGVIEGFAEATASFFKLFSGRLSDKLGKRKIFVVMGYVIAGIGKVFYGFATSWHYVLAGKFGERLGKGVRTSARDAMIAENTDYEKRGVVFGFHRSADTLGAVVGPLLAIVFLGLSNNNYRLIFFITLIPTTIAILLIIFFIKETPRLETGPLPSLSFKNIIKSRAFMLFLTVTIIFSLGNSADAFLILKARDLGLTITDIILAYVLYNVMYFLCAVPAGGFADRLGSRKVLLIGIGLFACIYISFGLISQPVLVWLLFPLYGIYMALTEGVGKAYISRIVPHAELGSAYGLYYMVTGFSLFFASVIAGLLFTYVGPSAPFYYGGIMAILAFIVMLCSLRICKRAECQ